MAELITNLGGGIATIPADPEKIGRGVARDSLGWISTGENAKADGSSAGQIELCRGRDLIGAEETASSYVQGHGWGYKADGTAIQFRKTGTKIQYHNTATDLWVDVVTGLTAEAEYTFSPYQSLAGTFIYATGADGIYKIHTANPGNYVSMYDAAKNYKGKSIIAEARMALWDTPKDKVSVYLSYTDSAQDSTVYTSVTKEVVGSGDGADTTFSGTLASVGSQRTLFNIQIAGITTSTTNITAITQAASAVVTSASHGLAIGDTVLFRAVVGMTEINDLIGTVTAVGSVNSFTVNINSTGFSAYSSGGTVGKCELFTDDVNGVLTSPAGGTGTINYVSGAWAVTFNAAPINSANNIVAAYAYENSNNKGVTDFTFSATRTALQGDVARQPEGGDAIERVVFHDGSYYSLKSRSVYKLTIASTGLSFTNIVFRKNIGIPYWQASVVTSKGIVFMDTANPDKPQLTILQPNVTGDNLEPVTLCNQFDFSAYTWDECAMDTFGEYIVFSGKSFGSSLNDKLFLYSARRGTIDILPYSAKTIAPNAGLLYIGDTLTDNVYQILSGFDDDNDIIENYWTSGDELYGTERLKKVRRIRLKGVIVPSQSLQVYFSPDGADFTLIGTILGNGDYVDYANQYTIGENGIGASVVGGEASNLLGSPYLAELKLSQGKFRKRAIKLVAAGIGYVSVNLLLDVQVRTFEGKLPVGYRTKTNVSLDGTQTNLDNPA